MTKILALYYSSWGHMEAMMEAAAAGAREAGAEVDIKRVPELVPEAVARASYYKLDQKAPVAEVGELANYDGFIIGTPTRFGNMCSQMKNFLDQTGGLWATGALINKTGTVIVSSATQHGGQETTLITTQIVLQHHGIIVVPLSYAYAGQSGVDTLRGGSPYGMTAMTDSDGSRWPSAQELEGATFQGKRFAEITAKLHG